MRMRFNIYAFLFVLFLPYTSNSQVSVESDSLSKKLLYIVNHEDNNSEGIIELAREILQVGVRLDSLEDIHLAYNWLSYIYKIRKEFIKAIEYTDSMLYYSRKADKLDLIFNSYVVKLDIGVLQKEYDSALLYNDTLLVLSKKIDIDSYFYRSYRRRAEIYLDKKDYEKAAHFANLSFSYAEKTTSLDRIGYSYVLNIKITHNAGQLDKAIELGKEMLTFFQETDNEYYIEAAFYWVIITLLDLNQHSEALEYGEQMRLWARENNLVDDFFYASTLIIRLHEIIPDYNQALAEINELFFWAIQSKNIDTISERYNWWMYFDTDFRKDKDILDYYLEKLLVDIKLGNKKYLAHDYFLIGTIYSDLKSSKQALFYFDLAKAIYEEFDDISGLAGVYHHIGNVYFDQREFEKSIVYYKECFEFYKKNNNYNNMAISCCNIGSAYEELKDDRSYEYLNKASEFASEYQIEQTNCLIYQCYGEYFLWKKELDKAQVFLKKSLKLAEENNFTSYICSNLLSLSDLYRDYEDYEKAFNYHMKYKELNDSLSDQSITSRAMQFEIQHKYSEERKRKSIQLIEKSKEIKINRLVLLVTFLTLVFISVIIYYLYRNKVKQDKLRLEKLILEKKFLVHELEYKEKELSAKIGHLVNKNDLISEVTEELMKSKARFKKENQRPVEDIIKKLQFNVNKEIWEEFELRFKQVHTGFYKNLSINFPSLTSNEMKLCAFIKLNMSTKDISSITNQTINSIEVARTRLRKKLNISNKSASLVDFLGEF